MDVGSSPHTRGLPGTRTTHQSCMRIIPAHAGFTTSGPAGALSAADHPRTRGVYIPWEIHGVSCNGSSPHTRGLPGTRTTHQSCMRIIPAHAGFTTSGPAGALSAADHPRTRGVYLTPSRTVSFRAGSSPHTRGLRAPRGRVHHLGGIIPAHAGFTVPLTSADTERTDHPRTRGVYIEEGRYKNLWKGSSPHTRGLLKMHGSKRSDNRIIPAHAGFTDGGRGVGCPRPDHPRTRGVYSRSIRSWASRRGSSPHTRGLRRPGPGRRPRSRDHPRTRGVYTSSSSTWAAALGSSPHTRGLHEECPGNPDATGIIPAHAGFTDAVVNWLTNPKDHPRTRGVYLRSAVGCTVSAGSSPHTRGLRPRAHPGRGRGRIIPAHAGFTAAARQGLWRTRDHPRTRGVYTTGRFLCSQYFGSSPHTRGLRDPAGGVHPHQRIIPAHAGFTGAGTPH